MVEGKLISGPRPIYPPLARQARIEGTVRLEAVISRDGTVLNLRALSNNGAGCAHDEYPRAAT